MAMLAKKYGIALLVVGTVILIAMTVVAGVLNKKINDSVKDIWVYKYDTKFDDPNYEDCSDSTRTYYFYNITNPNEVLMNGEKMVLDLVGPYNYSIRTCKYDVHVEDNIEYYREYVTVPELIETDKVKASDRLFVFNLGYNAVMRTIRSTVPDVAPEYFLASQVSGGILTTILAGLQSPGAIQQICLGASPVMLSQIKTQFLAQVRPTSEHIVMSNYVASNYADFTGFFNNVSYVGGISFVSGTSLGFTANSINLILNGGSSHVGIIQDLVTGSGVASILAMTDSTLIDATPMQLSALKLYLTNFVTNLNAQVVQVQNSIFYQQWTASDVIPTTDLNGDSIPDLELFPADSEISLETAAKLWNATSPTSVASSMGFATWYTAAFNSTISSTLSAIYGLNANQTSIISAWAVNFADKVAPQLLLSNYDISSTSDLTYAQWGLGSVLGGLSLHDTQPSLFVNVPEFALWAKSIGLPITFEALKAKSLLTDPVNGLLKLENMFALFTVYQQEEIVRAKWNISVPEATALSGYFSYFINTFADSYISSFFVNYTSGPIIGVSPVEYIWSKTDPLLAALQVKPYIGFSSSDEYPFHVREVADALIPKNRTIFLGGTEEELVDYLHQHIHKDSGNSTLNIWKKPYQVGGWSGAGFLPGFQDDSVEIWFDTYLRIINFTKTESVDFKGVTVNHYEIDQSIFLTSRQNKANSIFYQTIEGVVNLSTYYAPEIYSGLPDYHSFAPGYPSNVTIKSSPATWGGASFEVEPETGVTVKATAALAAYVMFHPSDRYYPGLNSTGLVPIYGQISTAEATQDDIDNVKLLFKLRNAALALNIVGPIVGGIMMLVGAVVVSYWIKLGRQGYMTETDVELS